MPASSLVATEVRSTTAHGGIVLSEQGSLVSGGQLSLHLASGHDPCFAERGVRTRYRKRVSSAQKHQGADAYTHTMRTDTRARTTRADACPGTARTGAYTQRAQALELA